MFNLFINEVNYCVSLQACADGLERRLGDPVPAHECIVSTVLLMVQVQVQVFYFVYIIIIWYIIHTEFKCKINIYKYDSECNGRERRKKPIGKITIARAYIGVYIYILCTTFYLKIY